MDQLPYVVDLMLEVADLNLKVRDLTSGEIRFTLTPASDERSLFRKWILRYFTILIFKINTRHDWY